MVVVLAILGVSFWLVFTGSHYVALSGLKPYRLGWLRSQTSACLCLLSDENKDLCYHSRLAFILKIRSYVAQAGLRLIMYR